VKNRQASLQHAEPLVGVDTFDVLQPRWQGPRFELDDGPSADVRFGIRRTLSALTLAALVVVGGVGFFHKMLPQFIEANKPKQAAKGKVPRIKNPQPANRDPADKAAKKRDDRHDQDADEEEILAAQAQIEERWRRHDEFVERRRKRHQEAFDGLRRFPNGFDRVAPEPADSFWKGPPSKPSGEIRFKELTGQ
jgi:hypothetical protein